MKSTIHKAENFQPVTLSVTFENEKELNLFASLMNTLPITESIEKLGGKLPEYEMFERVADISLPTEILSALEATPWFQHNFQRKK